MKKGNTLNMFKMPQSKKVARSEAETNQPWWDEWDAGDRHSETYLYIPNDVRELGLGTHRAAWRLTIPAVEVPHRHHRLPV